MIVCVAVLIPIKSVDNPGQSSIINDTDKILEFIAENKFDLEKINDKLLDDVNDFVLITNQ